MSGIWKMCVSQTIIILGMTIMYLSSTLWLWVIGVVVVSIGCYIGQMLLAYAELELDLCKLNYPLDKSLKM